MKRLGFLISAIILTVYSDIALFMKNDLDLKFLVNYAEWRGIKSMVWVNDPGIRKAQFIHHYKHFSMNSIFLTIIRNNNSLLQKFEEDSMLVRKTAIVFNLDHQTNQTLEMIINQMPKLDVSWLLISKNPRNNFTDRLIFTDLTLHVDLVIALRPSVNIFTNKNFWELNPLNPHIENCFKLTTNSSDYCLFQIYKIRREINESLIVNDLGVWNVTNKTTLLNTFKPIEQRLDFRQYPLKIGVRNSTQPPSLDTVDQNAMDENDEEDLIKIMEYITNFLKASPEILSYSKLGQKDVNSGEWSDLLKAVVDEGVDFALGNVVQTEERASDMAFTFIIMQSMRNIYFKPQISNELRDIFLIPFGPKLISSVIATSLLLAIIVAIIHRVQKSQTFALGDTIIWSIGIFSMQGSIWSPKTISGNITLIISLLFSLIIYNSYQAFITSVLSVEIVNIRSVTDLLKSNYEIGYAKNSPDEIYLRVRNLLQLHATEIKTLRVNNFQSVNDTQLQQIYLRGYLHNSVNNITDGLLKSTEGNYGFFASKHKARKELWLINNYRCNFHISEIQIHSTVNKVAFPMSRNSPYRKVINLSIIKMYETGVFKYIQSLAVPDLPKCKEKRKFRSAHLPDLMTAFGLLIIGGILSIIFLVVECLWKRKKRIYISLKRKINKE